MDNAEMVTALYLRRPMPEYSQAFDSLVQGIKDLDQPALAVLSSAVHAVELLKRCPGPLHLAKSGAFDANSFVAAAQGWAWGPLAAAEVGKTVPVYTSILWAEPECDSAERVAAQLRRRASAGADLRVIATGPLRRFLPAWQAAPRLAVRPLDPGRVTRLLVKAGWQVQETIAFHGPRSVAWTFLARAAEKLGRPDWGDRCILTMRKYYREPGWLWPLAPLALIHARAA